MATLEALGREMRDIQILVAVGYLTNAAPADASIHVKNGGNNDTSCVTNITQATSNASGVGQATLNSFAAGFEALAAQALSQKGIRIHSIRYWRRLL
jgi:hypothetical protein